MSDKDPRNQNEPTADRRTFLRRFLKKSAPLVVGVVAKPLEKLAPEKAKSFQQKGVVDRATVQAEFISDELKKEFEQTHEEFIRNNPDFFEKP
jgi:hypothetical protein